MKFNGMKMCFAIWASKPLVCSMGALPAKFVIDRHASRQASEKTKKVMT